MTVTIKDYKMMKYKNNLHQRRLRFIGLCVICVMINALLLFVFVSQPMFESRLEYSEVCSYNFINIGSFESPGQGECFTNHHLDDLEFTWVEYYWSLSIASCFLFISGIIFGIAGIVIGWDMGTQRKRFNSLIITYGISISTTFNAYLLGKCMTGITVSGYNNSIIEWIGESWVSRPSLVSTPALVLIWLTSCVFTIIMAFFIIAGTLNNIKNAPPRIEGGKDRINGYKIRLAMVITLICLLISMSIVPFVFTGQLQSDYNRELNNPPHYEKDPIHYTYLSGDKIHLTTWFVNENYYGEKDRYRQLKSIDNSLWTLEFTIWMTLIIISASLLRDLRRKIVLKKPLPKGQSNIGLVIFMISVILLANSSYFMYRLNNFLTVHPDDFPIFIDDYTTMGYEPHLYVIFSLILMILAVIGTWVESRTDKKILHPRQ